MDVIKFEDVCYSYPRAEKFALDGINLSVGECEFLAVMGENGAGKTTFCKLINGIIPHLSGGRLSGKVTVDGCDTYKSSVPELALKVGMVLDDPDAQLFTSTVRHEAAFGAENICLPPEEIEDRVKYALSAVGLCGFEERTPSTLSGGEKQRLSIAAALSMKGRILVLDEPLCRLDPEGAAEVMSVLNDIKTKYRITIVMAAHNNKLIAEYAGRICVLKNGKIAALDTAENILTNFELLKENGIEPLAVNSGIHLTFLRSPKLADQQPAVEIKNFCFTYPNGASIENINLTINDNDFAAITGGNGSGKTTLLNNITGLLRPSCGDIFIRGRNTKELSVSEISMEAGYVMQNPDSQLFTDSVFKEAAFALKNRRGKHRLSENEIKKRVDDALAVTGLRDADAFPHALSISGRAMTVIACVLAMGVKIIILDEVDIGNDYKGCIKIMNIAEELHSKGYTIIFVTHNISLACAYAHRLIKIDRKGIVFDGRKDQFALNEELNILK